MRRIVRWRLGSTASAQDREDIAGDILLDLLKRLDDVDRPVEDLSAYAAIVSQHGCDRYLRRRFPQRHRLGTRVRYLMENSSQFTIWQTADGLVAGPVRYRGRPCRSDLAPGWAREVPVPAKPDEARAAAAVFEHAGAPLRLPDLVDAVAILLNVVDRVASIADIDIAAPDIEISDLLHQRQTLERLWREIALLPQPQRVALLLNLRDEENGCALTGLPSTGVASMREIAAIVGLSAEKLADLWNGLPLNDLEIAAMLDVSRQQVINLRKSARARLQRRMAGNILPDSPSSHTGKND